MAKDLARSIGYIYIDSGAMYRAVTLYAIENGMFAGDVLDEQKLKDKIGNVTVSFKMDENKHVPVTCLNGTEVRFENFSDMLDSADAIRMVESNLYWHDWTRFSSRQKTYMQLGGLQGSVLYEGNLAPFLPFCELAEKIHIGKQTSFGLGQTKAEIVDRRLLCREF